jgi:hypothetical protein
VKISPEVARGVLRTAAARVDGGVYPAWIAKVEKLSALCEDGTSKTHIAYFGTAVLAKAVDARADLFAPKPTLTPDNQYAFSARSLCHGVLVPLSAELGFSLGVTGREPLNNQPYFRMTRLDDGTPVHSGGRLAFDYMLTLLRELQGATLDDARDALAAFVTVRRRYRVTYGDHVGVGAVSPSALAETIRKFVTNSSEGGRRAQAVAAGVFDVVFGTLCVESGRINDPSRHYPGDVCIRREAGLDDWIKAIEVRDKPVTASDVQIFANRCAQLGVREAAVLMVADGQTDINQEALQQWADDLGIGLTLFVGWADFVGQALFWSVDPKPEAAAFAVGTIRARLIAVEASPEAVDFWSTLTEQ